MKSLSRSLSLVLVLGCALLGGGLTLPIGPHTPRLAAASNGDRQLATDVRASLSTDRGYQSLSAARLQDGKVVYAGLGDAGRGSPPTPETPFELGSITKTFTGALLTDGIERGELQLDAPLGTYLTELADSEVGASTLRQLATHTAGLPPFPDSATPFVLVRVLGNQNVYSGSTASMIDAARTTKIKSRGTYAYSNLGMALLGHAEARAAGAVDWPTLATQRILEPLGMRHTTFALERDDIPTGATHPYAENGWPAAYWFGPAFAPAGSSTWTTAADLMRWAQAVLDGTAPGSSAVEPVEPIPSGQIGLAWHISDRDGQPVTWHNGGTGGFRTILALDRERQQAMLILGNSTRDTDTTGRELAVTAPGSSVEPVERIMINWVALVPWVGVGVALILGLLPSIRRPQRVITVVAAAVSATAGLLILLARGPWMIIPAWTWGAVAGATICLAVLAFRRTGRSGSVLGASDRRRRPWLSLVSSVVMLAVAAWVM